MVIKQLRQRGEAFAPQTVAEAVLIKHNGSTTTIDKVINLKIESIKSDDLSVTRTGPEVVIVHANNVTPVELPKPLLIKYDAHGHITGSEPVKALKISVNGNKCVEYDGTQESELKLGDDFETNNENVRIRWNTLT